MPIAAAPTYHSAVATLTTSLSNRRCSGCVDFGDQVEKVELVQIQPPPRPSACLQVTSTWARSL